MASCHSGQCQVHRQIFSKFKKAVASPPSQPAISRIVSSCVMHPKKCNSCLHLYAFIPTSNLQTSVNLNVPGHVFRHKKKTLGKESLARCCMGKAGKVSI